MAINIGENNNSSAPSQAAGIQPNPQAQGGAQQGTAVKRWNLKGGTYASPLGNGQFNEIFSKTKEKLINEYKGASDAFRLQVLGIDRIERPNLAYSVIVVVGSIVNDPKQLMAYHVLILEGTGRKPMPLQTNVDGRQIEIFRVASDAVDDILIREVNNLINREIGKKNVIATDVTVLGAKFNPEEPSHVFRVARNTALAIATTLEMAQPTFEDINLKQVDIDNNLVINVDFNAPNITDDVGNLIRSDVMIGFSAQGDMNNKRSLNTGDSDDHITEVDGFIDLLWNPVIPQAYNPFMQNQMQMQMMQGPAPKYSARFIITNLISTKAYTTGGILLALYTALAINDNNNWVQYFRPIETPPKALNIKDIGALGIEANFDNNQSGFGSVIDTRTSSFSLEELGKLVAALIRPNLGISMDIPDSGPQTWYESIFAAAADGKEGAIREIINAANQLTNGGFAQNFKGKIFSQSADGRIHMGSYMDMDGREKDIREIDYIAVCNYAAQNNQFQFIKDWSDTFVRLDYREEERLYQRRKMIMAITGQRAEITGMARRVTFDGNFMEALSAGIMSTGLNTIIKTPMSSDLFNSSRAAASFLSSDLISTGNHFNTRTMMGGGFNPYSYGYTRY